MSCAQMPGVFRAMPRFRPLISARKGPLTGAKMTFPDITEPLPDIGKRFSEYKNGFPDITEPFPDHGKLFHDITETFPESMKSFPNITKSFPDVRNCACGCGTVDTAVSFLDRGPPAFGRRAGLRNENLPGAYRRRRAGLWQITTTLGHWMVGRRCCAAGWLTSRSALPV